MGTFANLYTVKGATLPEHKREEFIQRLEKLFQLGGMMDISHIRLYGKKLTVIQKATMDESGMNVFYNYFEDDNWENAGFSTKKNCGVWSNKIGWSEFHLAVVAAYTLEELYTDGIIATMVNGELVTSWKYVGWINYLFNEHYHVKNFDPWKLFEALHYANYDYMDILDFNFGDKRYAFIGKCEIYAVSSSTQEAIERYFTEDIENPEKRALTSMKNARNAIKKYAHTCELNREQQLTSLMDIFRKYYMSTDRLFDEEQKTTEEYKEIFVHLLLSDAPAFFVKAIAEEYHKNFWDLWDSIKDIVHRKLAVLYGNEDYYVVPISTADFFKISADDMIPYWEEACAFEFSQDLWEWFKVLKTKFDTMLNTDFHIEHPLPYILDLMEEADENYYHIFTFKDFFEESMEHLSDKRFLVLWKMYEEMIRDPELKSAGDVIFVPEGPEYEHVGIFSRNKSSKRRLLRYWDITEHSKKFNKARITFRRYMALVANKELRFKVFGF